MPCCHYLAVALYCQGLGKIIAYGEIGNDLTSATESSIQAAIEVVACQSKIVSSAGTGTTPRHDLAIGLDRYGYGSVGATELGDNLAVATECGVQDAD